MFRQDFIDNINDWGELIDFCYDEDCDFCDDIYAEDARDEEIHNDLNDWIGYYHWSEIRDRLDNIETGYDYYCRDEWSGNWVEADDELFEQKKEEVLQWMDDGGWWEDENDDENSNTYCETEIEEERDEEDLIPLEAEDISVTDLFMLCNNGLRNIKDMQAEEEKIAEEKFDSFVMSYTVV